MASDFQIIGKKMPLRGKKKQQRSSKKELPVVELADTNTGKKLVLKDSPSQNIFMLLQNTISNPLLEKQKIDNIPNKTCSKSEKKRTLLQKDIHSMLNTILSRVSCEENTEIIIDGVKLSKEENRDVKGCHTSDYKTCDKAIIDVSKNDANVLRKHKNDFIHTNQFTEATHEECKMLIGDDMQNVLHKLITDIPHRIPKDESSCKYNSEQHQSSTEMNECSQFLSGSSKSLVFQEKDDIIRQRPNKYIADSGIPSIFDTNTSVLTAKDYNKENEQDRQNDQAKTHYIANETEERGTSKKTLTYTGLQTKPKSYQILPTTLNKKENKTSTCEKDLTPPDNLERCFADTNIHIKLQKMLSEQKPDEQTNCLALRDEDRSQIQRNAIKETNITGKEEQVMQSKKKLCKIDIRYASSRIKVPYASTNRNEQLHPTAIDDENEDLSVFDIVSQRNNTLANLNKDLQNLLDEASDILNSKPVTIHRFKNTKFNKTEEDKHISITAEKKTPSQMLSSNRKFVLSENSLSNSSSRKKLKLETKDQQDQPHNRKGHQNLSLFNSQNQLNFTDGGNIINGIQPVKYKI